MIVLASWVTPWVEGLLSTQLLATKVEEIKVVNAEKKTVEKETVTETGLIVQNGIEKKVIGIVNGKTWKKIGKKWKEIGINLNAEEVKVASLMLQLSCIQ